MEGSLQDAHVRWLSFFFFVSRYICLPPLVPPAMTLRFCPSSACQFLANSYAAVTSSRKPVEPVCGMSR